MTTINSQWEATEEAEDGQPVWLGTFIDEPERLVLLAPVKMNSNVYGWYESSAPTFIVTADQLAAVLAATPEDAYDMLRDGVAERESLRGDPFHIERLYAV